ncbi:hypothetical protein [Rhizobacter fulvus]
MSSKTESQRGKGKTNRRIPWDAVERDYRTGAYTLRELQARHSVDNSSIARRMRQDRAIDPTRWAKDLTEAVRQATQDRLLRETIASTAEGAAATCQQTSRHQQVADEATVNTVATENTRILLSHRRSLARLAVDADRLQEFVAKTEVADLASLGRAANALETLGRLRRMIIERERESFGIDAVSTKPLRDISDEELTARLNALLAQTVTTSARRTA